mgnify:FL=1
MGISLPPVAIAILLANVIVSYKGFNDEIFFNRFHFQVRKIKQGEYIRLLSSGFLHVGTSHLIFNMITFYFFAAPVIYSIGNIPFLVVYFGSLLAGNAFANYFHRDEPFYTAVGASGAVTGILFSSILLYPALELYMFFIPIPIPGYLFAVGYLAYTLYGMKKQNDTIGHTAHFGGALGGILITLIFAPAAIYESQLTLGLLTATCALVGYILFRSRKK